MADEMEIISSKSGKKGDGKRKQMSLLNFVSGAAAPAKKSSVQQTESDNSS